MNYLYSLYDALVSISVPSDKARAVVDAMERDMGSTLATKQDLLLLRQEMTGSDNELKQGVASLGTELKQVIASLRTELKQEIESRYTLLDQKIDTLGLKLTAKLGSMLVVGFGLTIAAIRLWI